MALTQSLSPTLSLSLTHTHTHSLSLQIAEGSGYGGAITAALYLEKFVSKVGIRGRGCGVWGLGFRYRFGVLSDKGSWLRYSMRVGGWG